jgi:hypothetical protein
MRSKRLRRRRVQRSPFKKFAARKPRMAGKRRKLEDMKHGELEHLLDAEISFHVRASAAVEVDLGGIVPCYTCGGFHHWKQLDAGHYIGRANRGTRWDLRNIRPQCTKCNSYQEGEHWKFRQALVTELGASEVEKLELIASAYGASKLPREWLIEQITEWREKNKKLRRDVR